MEMENESYEDISNQICGLTIEPPSKVTLTALPTELIQEIAWLSHNPNLYLVCRNLSDRLFSRRDYMQDLSFLLLCDRRDRSSGWYAASIPWRTGPARRWDLNPEQIERSVIQQQVFDLEFINQVRLTMMIRFLLRLWVDINYPHLDNLSKRQNKRLETYLTTASDACLRSDLEAPVSCNKDHLIEDRDGHRLLLSNDGGMSVSNGGQVYKRTKHVVSMLHIPTRLLVKDEDGDSSDLAKTLLYRTKMDSLNHLIVKKRVATAKPGWMAG